ncbi:MAG: hypothetical protein K8I30_22980, partial [Anaerolineae bacterium]|nr:hypothetical protein [Anaerolineae bacterium]
EGQMVNRPLTFRDQLVVDTLERGIEEYGRWAEEQQRLYDNLSYRDKVVVDTLERGIEEYSRWVDEQQALYEKLSYRDQVVVDALERGIAEYARENGLDGYEVANSVRNGTRRAIDGSNLPYKGMTKWHIINLINQAVVFEVPSQVLPINGYWRVRPFTMTVTGECQHYDCDGCGGATAGELEDDPGQPLCGYANTGGLPFITWQGAAHPYLPGTGSIYSQEPDEWTESRVDANGATTGSVKMTRTTEYRVVAPDLIVVTLVIQEEGGCTMSAEFEIELVTPDESVCPPLSELPSDLLTTPAPESTPMPLVEAEGPFRAGLPLILDENQCTADNTPPQLTEVFLRSQDDGSKLIDYGTGT